MTLQDIETRILDLWNALNFRDKTDVMLEIGDLCLEVKRRKRHGEFEDWLFPFGRRNRVSARSLRDWMQYAKVRRVADLPDHLSLRGFQHFRREASRLAQKEERGASVERHTDHHVEPVEYRTPHHVQQSPSR